MASVNLSSLSTFWSAIKNFFKTNSYESVVLYEGAAINNVSLSESINNFERIEVSWSFDYDGFVICNEFVPSLTTEFFSFYSSWINIGGNVFFKIATFQIGSNRKTITNFKSTNCKFTFASPSTATRSINTSFLGISKVVGINRIANN